MSGWSQTTGDEWRFFWSDQMHDASVFDSLSDGQLVNHFPGIAAIVSKDSLFYYLSAAAERATRQGARQLFDFFPGVYSMPHEYDAFVKAAAAEPGRLWIQKPKGDWGGHGIELISDMAHVKRGEEWLVQQYISKPLLLPGHPYKHVLRIYLLITSLEPLVVYMHSVGGVRFTSRPYTEARSSLSDFVAHFINGYLQKRNAATPVWTEDFDTYRQRLRAAGIDDGALWDRIRRMLVLTAIAHREPILGGSLNRTRRLDCCFELLGADVLIDDTLKPWLLECNMTPALGLDAPVGTPDRQAQRRSREPVIADMLRILGLFESTQTRVTADRDIDHFLVEGERRGGFERIFPGTDARRALSLLQIPRPADLALTRAVEGLTDEATDRTR
jgi:tubulin polyglutamylase TTLL5